MAPLPAIAPGHRPALGAAGPAGPVSALRYLRLLARPGLVGRRVEVRVTDREVIAVALDTGELACRHPRSFAKHRTITALEHARTLKTQRARAPRRRAGRSRSARSRRYDALIA